MTAELPYQPKDEYGFPEEYDFESYRQDYRDHESELIEDVGDVEHLLEDAKQKGGEANE